MPNTAPSRADPVVVFPLSRWCPPQETSQPHPPPLLRLRLSFEIAMFLYTPVKAFAVFIRISIHIAFLNAQRFARAQ